MTEDYQSELSEVYKELESGEIGIEEAMQRSNTLTTETASKKAIEQATKQFQTTLQERDAEAIQKKFLKDNPDFAELRDSGKLEPIKQESGGMHDDFSAYFAYKAQHPMEEENPALETPEEASKPGAPLSQSEMEESMLKAMEKVGKER